MPDQTAPSLGDAGQSYTPDRCDRSFPPSSPATKSLRENVTAWLHYLQDPVHNADIATEIPDSGLVDLLRGLEELKSAAAAVQARVAAAFDASQRKVQARAGVPAEYLGRGVGTQVALARRDSPHRGGRHLGLGKALVHEMPHTLAALSAGVLSEWRATLLVRETACLDLEDRARVDELLCKDPAALEGLGDRRLISRIRSVTQALDPASQVRRNAKAVAERHVSCRPAPDTMCYLSALLPVAQGVAVFAALSRAADSLRAAGDDRGRGQIMADTLVQRVTGQATAHQVPVEVQLLITDRTLLGAPGPDEPAYFPGYGTVPGQWARDLVAATRAPAPAPAPAPGPAPVPAAPVTAPAAPAPAPAAKRPAAPASAPVPAAGTDGQAASPPGTGNPVSGPASPPGCQVCQAAGPGAPDPDLVSLRRLYLDPVSGELVAMESTARAFPAGLARLIRTRDQSCRTPWCDAPIRHIDHIQPHADGGPTSYTNGQGLCEACNQAKEAPGWTATPAARNPGTRHTVRITTPTGHSYTSTAPALPGTLPERGQAGGGRDWTC